MSLIEIKKNIDDLESKSKEELISYVQELLIHTKRQESKNISLKTEIKFLNRHMKKVRDVIDKVLASEITETKGWNNER